VAQWNERFRDHQIWQALQMLGPLIDQALVREGNDSQANEALSRLKVVHIYIGRRLAGADQYLLTVAPLDGLSSSLQSVFSEVQQYVASGNPSHLTNANNHMDAALGPAAQLIVPTTTEDFKGAREAAESYRQALVAGLSMNQTMVSQSSSEVDGLRTRVAELVTQIDSERTRLSAISTEFQGQFSTAQETRNREFAEAQKLRQDAFAPLMADYQTKLGEQNTAFSSQREDIARKHSDDLKSLREAFVESAATLRNEIVQHKEEVESLLGVIGSMGVTSGYQHSANEAKWTTRVWQVVTIAALAGLVGVAIHAFLPIAEGTFSWGAFAGRTFVALTIGVLAAYAAKQADGYQKTERINRRLALELQAMGPFIAPLPAEKQEEFRLKIGDRSFGHRDDGVFVGDSASPATLLDLVLHSKEFKVLLAEVVKAAKANT